MNYDRTQRFDLMPRQLVEQDVERVLRGGLGGATAAAVDEGGARARAWRRARARRGAVEHPTRCVADGALQ